jgi:hypothetical protein
MRIVGVIELVAGIVVLLGGQRFTRIGAYVVSAWLVCIALNLLTMGQFLDVAVRDLTMACGAFTLAKLEEAALRGLIHAPKTHVPASSRSHA